MTPTAHTLDWIANFGLDFALRHPMLTLVTPVMLVLSVALYLVAGYLVWERLNLNDRLRGVDCPFLYAEDHFAELTLGARAAYHTMKVAFLLAWPVLLLAGWVGAKRAARADRLALKDALKTLARQGDRREGRA